MKQVYGETQQLQRVVDQVPFRYFTFRIKVDYEGARVDIESTERSVHVIRNYAARPNSRSHRVRM